jgi:hypothetical protein
LDSATTPRIRGYGKTGFNTQSGKENLDFAAEPAVGLGRNPDFQTMKKYSSENCGKNNDRHFHCGNF